MRVLILGGTGFIGPHFVRAALARGHDVTVFNRGVSPADLPDEVVRLRGERGDDLDALVRGAWDATLDLACYVPEWVTSLGEILGARAGHYVFVSTVGVYAPVAGDRTEAHPKRSIGSGSADPIVQYGESKYACELEAVRQFGDDVLIVRPSNILGPGSLGWIPRIDRGGLVLAPGAPGDPFQLIDVRDLAEWVMDATERRVSGAYNALMHSTWGDYLAGIVRATSSDADLVWVPADWLVGSGVDPSKLPMWYPFVDRPATGDGWYDYRHSNESALSEGMMLRPLAATLADSLAWIRTRGTQWEEFTRWDDDEERDLIGAWHRQGEM